tara:strand:+ start:86 stop:250 length:165 start_codon:yes stop_codon:yes gene_type:complete
MVSQKYITLTNISSSQVMLSLTLLGNVSKTSIDGKVRALDNIYIESFWRTLRDE